MSIKSVIFVAITLFCHILANESDADSVRKGKFLGITGYLSGKKPNKSMIKSVLNLMDFNWSSDFVLKLKTKSGSTDFQVVPFWKQWNALLQVNVEKNKHKHNGVYIIPAPSYYYPPYDNPYSFYYPPNFGGGLLHPNSLHRPMPLLFDDYKQTTTTLVWSFRKFHFFSLRNFLNWIKKNGISFFKGNSAQSKLVNQW